MKRRERRLLLLLREEGNDESFELYVWGAYKGRWPMPVPSKNYDIVEVSKECTKIICK